MGIWQRLVQRIRSSSRRDQVVWGCISFWSVIFFVFILLLTTRGTDRTCYTTECISAAYHVLTTVDQTVDPCDDFYKFACGNYLKTAIEYDQASPLATLDIRKKNALRQLIMEDRTDEKMLAMSFRNQRKFFKACMNTSAIEEDSDEAFLEDLKFVTGGWPLSLGYALDGSWPETMVRAREKGLLHNFFLDIDINVDFNYSKVFLEVRPPPKEYSTQKLWRETNVQKIIEIAEHWGNHSVSASWEVRKTFEFANELNKIVEKAHENIQNSTVDQGLTKISELMNSYSPRIQWLDFLKNMTGLKKLHDTDVILFRVDEEYFKNLYYLMQKTQSKFWTDYIVILMLTDDCGCLSKRVRELCNEFVESKSSKSRGDFCFEEALSQFESVAEAQYVRKIATPQKRKSIDEMIADIKNEMEISLKNNRWMDKKTKKSAVEHLHKITTAIGWTDFVFNETEYERLFGFAKVELPNNLILMKHNLNRLFYDHRFEKVRQPFEFQIEHAVSVPVLEVNAFYVRYWDILILVAPILHSPIYELHRPEYLNYGALGSIIGHELTHAFAINDEESRQLYRKGNPDFWSHETHASYSKQTKCLIEEYEKYARDSGVTLENSTSSLDENIADFTGLNLAYRAYQKWVDRHGPIDYSLPGLKFTSNQLFWIMASTYMCMEPKLKNPEKMYTSPNKRGANAHALNSFRVVGPIRNSPHFGNDFGCTMGRKMNPPKKCMLFV